MAKKIPPNILPGLEQFREAVGSLTVEELQASRRCFGFDFTKGKKAALVSAVLEFLSFGGSEENFHEWIGELPSWLAMAIKETAFFEFIDPQQVSLSVDKPVLVKHRYYHRGHYEINPDLRLGIFELYQRYGILLLYMKPQFRAIFSRLLPKPRKFGIGPCEQQNHAGWSAADTLSESMSLLLKSINRLTADPRKHEKILRRGLNKGEIKELRRSSAFPAFPLGSKWGTDPIDLIIRFLIIDPDHASSAPMGDEMDYLKQLVCTFFIFPESGRIVKHNNYLDSTYEFTVLSPHLANLPGTNRYDFDMHPFPPSRTIFHQLISIMAKSGSWFKMEELAGSIQMQNLPFFLPGKRDVNPVMVLKGEELLVPQGRIQADEWEKGFRVDWYLKHLLVTRPLLRGYCYLMASLGLLEIAEEEPEKPLKKRGKMVPISSFDSLAYARITPFGAWCLGISEEKPEPAKVCYEAIADRDLPLVTCRGHSLECKIYLERIGEPLGEERYRISEASLIRECKSMEEITSRINDFHRLVADEPAAHWKDLFSRVRQRAELFQNPKRCFMIHLPADKELRRLFLEDKKISSLVTRAEGGRIVVEEKNYQKLRKALETFGFLNLQE
jgi:hypothetical protein